MIWYSCVSGGVIGDKIIIGSGNGLVPNWHQVIAWTSVDQYIQQRVSAMYSWEPIYTKLNIYAWHAMLLDNLLWYSNQ